MRALLSPEILQAGTVHAPTQAQGVTMTTDHSPSAWEGVCPE